MVDESNYYDEADEEFEIALRPLFLGMPDEWIEDILSISEDITYKSGEHIIKQGSHNKNIYVVLKGKADVILENYEDETTHNIITLDSKPTMYNLYIGDIVGEISIIDLEAASASVVAASDEVVCKKIPINEITDILRDNKDLHIMLITNIAKIISRRLRNTNKILSKYFYLKTEENKKKEV